MKPNKLSLSNYFMFSLVIVPLFLCYFTTIKWLNYKYAHIDSYYSHGYLIPFISAYIIFTMRDELKLLEIKTSILGLFLVLIALLTHFFAVMSDVNFISGFSLFLWIYGTILYLYGTKITYKLTFPLLFLLFMFPIPDIFIDYVGIPTKTFAMKFGLLLINFIGIPYYQEGFRITLVNTTLVVGTPCNGVKSMIAFMALTLLLLYKIRPTIVKGIIIILMLYPLTVIVNGIRIALLILIAYKYGVEKAAPESLLHDLSGIFVFIIGLIIIFLITKNMKRKTT